MFKMLNMTFNYSTVLLYIILYDLVLGCVKLRYSIINQTTPKVHIIIKARQNYNTDVLVNIKDETMRLTTNPE